MIVYIHPKCTTCKKALKWFELNDVPFEQKERFKRARFMDVDPEHWLKDIK